MRERIEPILKLVCAVLAVLLLVQVAGAARRFHPLKRTSVPPPPTWTPPPPPTNAPAGGGGGPGRGSMPPGMPPGMMGGGRPGGGPPLTPEIEARIDKVIQSEILGPVMRPPPMALIGIAGRDVLLRAPNGQTGLVREGAELGGIKILRIGTNRVLIQEGADIKELTIFEGMGGESLLPKGKEGTP